MSRTTKHECPTSTPDLDAGKYQHLFQYYQQEFVTIGLIAGLHGVLTTLSMISCYTILRRGRKQKPAATPLCLAIIVLFSSTTIYTITCILNLHSDMIIDLLYFADISSGCRWRYHKTWFEFKPWHKDEWMHGCGGAATLTVNVVLGDAIVCWRACVIWHKNHVVKAICGVFLLATFVLGVIDTCQSCQPNAKMTYGHDMAASTIPGSLFEELPTGVATSALSLSTNILATILVTYKAWKSRRSLKGYLVARVGGSQVEMVLSLLIESGVIYSAIWSVVVAFQVIQIKVFDRSGSASMIESHFVEYFSIIMNGALVPAIAIYPTIIIVLVALNRSHLERGISQHLDSLPTPRLSITDNTITTGRIHGSRTNQGPEERVLRRQGL